MLPAGRRLLSTSTPPKPTVGSFLARELRRLALGGSFHDLKVANEADGKLFEGRNEVDDSEPMEPPLRMRALDGTTKELPDGRTTLLLLAFNQLGWNSVQSWRGFVPPKSYVIGNKPSGTKKKELHFFQLSVAESRLAGFASKSLEEALKKTVPVDQHAQTAIWTGSFEQHRRCFGIENRAVAYALLIDGTGRLRWRSTGDYDEELDGESLSATLSSLVK